VEQIEQSRVSRYGVIDGKESEPGVYLVRDFVEKPAVEEAPSNLVIAGRYILTPDIFEYLRRTEPRSEGEIQLTDAMRMMVRERPMYGLRLDGRRCDIGSKEGFIKTNIEFALKREDMAEELREFIKETAERI
jgi:UTP--glucose-1-phosphate uridylyltransferase